MGLVRVPGLFFKRLVAVLEYHGGLPGIPLNDDHCRASLQVKSAAAFWRGRPGMIRVVLRPDAARRC